MRLVEQYLKTLSEIHRTGGATAETSYYAALEALLNDVGAKLKPRVRAVSQLANTGGGSPDFGLFTANQFQRSKDDLPIEGAPPERGVVEVKGWKDDSFVTAKTEQVSKYWKHYGLVLVTNYRDFVLIGRDEAGRPLRLETCRMAESETAFRALLAHPRKADDAHGERLLDFLRRVLLYEAVLADPEDLAWFLASYAREARHRVEAAAALPALEGLKKALEEALGMTFEGEKGQHFFRATLVQTLFYGVFSSWVLWSRDHSGQPQARFDWHNAAWTLHVPMVKSLFDQIATPSKLKPLGIDEVLDWAGAALNRVDCAAFFSRFEEEHAVQYFYEPFLKAYDPELRKELGVWYTPPEIVQYQVERVDRVLREELGIADGLADDRVVVLDPCCGTGAYLVETLKRIHKTLEEQGGSALTAQRLKQAAMQRVFGFELLPAPFVVAHLQLGLMLRVLGAPLDHDSDQRAGVYLTNALTGWEPPKEPKNQLPLFPELMQERDAANKVKQEAPILVILGNPPYNGYAGLAMEEERDLVTAYRTTRRAPKPEGQGLNDLYVRFFRMAERRIVEKSGKGVICYISNYSWLEGLSHTGMRERYLEVFDKIWIDNLHGDRIISEYAPDGKTSETVFAMGGQSPGIKIGTAISLLVVTDKTRKAQVAQLRYMDYTQARAAERRGALLATAKAQNINELYRKISPEAAIGLPFKPAQVDAGYLSWPQLPELFPTGFSGVKTARDDGLVDVDLSALEGRIQLYFDADVNDARLKALVPCLMTGTNRFNAEETRRYLQSRGPTSGVFVRYYYRPFDIRWLYWEPETKLLDEKRSDYMQNVGSENLGIILAQRTRRGFEPPIVTARVASYHVVENVSIIHPIYTLHRSQDDLFPGENGVRLNASPALVEYLELVPAEQTSAAFLHAIAILHSPAYSQGNEAALRQDWPRIPLPSTKEALLASAALGRRVAALLDTEKPVEGVTCGKLEPRLKALGVIRKVGGGSIDPDKGELDVTAGWGHGGKGGVCMPGRGKVEERGTQDAAQVAAFGEPALDVYLNDAAYWENVPGVVWEYTIGGYQVIKKWLSYREKGMLGRGLTLDEAAYVTEMIRRIAALILLQPELDANYARVKADTWPWPKK